jgi:hypothetical protein
MSIDMQNWNGGNRLTITSTNGAQCVNSIVNPINVAFLYNTTEAAQDVPVNLVGSNQFVTQVKIPQTTADQGSAALLTFSGPPAGSASITATIPTSSSSAQAQVWLGSQAMPTNTSGLNNFNLPADGKQYSFNKYARAYFVPAAQHYSLTVTTGVAAFYFAVFNSSGQVAVYVLNAPSPTYKPIVQQFPNDTYAANNTTVTALTQNSVSIPIFGQNQQWVLMNADSTSDSISATVSLQSLG